MAKGPKNSFKDPRLNDELQNVYYDIQNVLKGSTVTINNLSVSSITVAGSSAGKVKTINSFSTSADSSTTTSAFAATNLTLSITPKSTNNRIRVTVSGSFHGGAAGNDIRFAVFRNGSSDSGTFLFYPGAAAQDQSVSYSYISQPASIASQTYTLYFSISAGSTVTFGNGTEKTIILEEFEP